MRRFIARRGIETTDSLAHKLIAGEFKRKLLKWPAYSPDINPLENVWFLLDQAKNRELDRRVIDNEALPKNKKEMFDLLRNCWNELDDRTVRRIYFSFLNRLRKVKLNFGRNNFDTRTRNLK